MKNMYLEIISCLISLSSVILDTNQKIVARLLSLIGIFISFFVYYSSGLYARCMLNVIYTVLHLYGWYIWRYGGKNQTPLPVSRTVPELLCLLILLGVICTVVLGSLLKTYTNTDFPYWDSCNIAFCLIAQWMLINKKLETWMVWLLTAAFYTHVCFCKGLYFFAAQHFIYIFINIYGYIAWSKSYLNHVKTG